MSSLVVSCYVVLCLVDITGRPDLFWREIEDQCEFGEEERCVRGLGGGEAGRLWSGCIV